MFENTTVIKLIANHKEISYWAESDSEVDFIVEKTAINVTSTDNLPKREQKGLEEFSKKHKGFDLKIISHSLKKDNVMPLSEFIKQE